MARFKFIIATSAMMSSGKNVFFVTNGQVYYEYSRSMRRFFVKKSKWLLVKFDKKKNI